MSWAGTNVTVAVSARGGPVSSKFCSRCCWHAAFATFLLPVFASRPGWVLVPRVGVHPARLRSCLQSWRERGHGGRRWGSGCCLRNFGVSGPVEALRTSCLDSHRFLSGLASMPTVSYPSIDEQTGHRNMKVVCPVAHGLCRWLVKNLPVRVWGM